MNNDQASITVTTAPYGRSGGVSVTIRYADGQTYTDRCIIGDARKRAAFIESFVELHPSIPSEALAAELERAAAAAVEGGGPKPAHEDSQATAIVAMLVADPSVELFHAPGGHDAVPYATVPVNGHRQTWPLRSLAFRQWMSRMFYSSEGDVPGAQALADATNTLCGKAVFEGPQHEVYIRIAYHEGDIWLDLADGAGRAVQVTQRGWRVVEADIPVRFIRRQGMMPLPAPVIGGRIDDLRRVVNLPEDDLWILAVSWLIGAFRPDHPFTLLNVTGEQGCAKSTLCKMLRSLVDPSKPLLRRPPKDDRDLMIASKNCWVVGYDNISAISNGLSDSLCSLATGGGFATRQLFTDDDETIFDAMRPVIVNGIEDAVTRPDLLDRSINLHLPVIPPEERRDEDVLWAEFHRLRPGILGAVLDVVTMGLRNINKVTLPTKPRMADFAMWVTAAEPLLPWEAGAFMAAYVKNRGQADALALEGCPIGPTVVAMMSNTALWEGTATDLLNDLNRRANDQSKELDRWPRTAQAAAGHLRRIAPSLRAMGIDVRFLEPMGHEKRRLIRIQRGGKPGSAGVVAPAGYPDQGSVFDDGRSYSVGWTPDAEHATPADADPGAAESEAAP